MSGSVTWPQKLIVKKPLHEGIWNSDVNFSEFQNQLLHNRPTLINLSVLFLILILYFVFFPPIFQYRSNRLKNQILSLGGGENRTPQLYFCSNRVNIRIFRKVAVTPFEEVTAGVEHTNITFGYPSEYAHSNVAFPQYRLVYRHEIETRRTKK